MNNKSKGLRQLASQIMDNVVVKDNHVSKPRRMLDIVEAIYESNAG